MHVEYFDNEIAFSKRETPSLHSVAMGHVKVSNQNNPFIFIRLTTCMNLIHLSLLYTMNKQELII